MAGQNIYKAVETKSFRGILGQPCVFISHRRADTNAAKFLADYLLSIDINIYFDEYDGLLQAATASGETEKIVMYIENGITYSSHLLGVISSKTEGSWWVPFEIGHAKRKCTMNQMSLAYLLLENVERLPEYLKIERRILDEMDLAKWIRQELGRQIYLSRRLGWSSLDMPEFPDIRTSGPNFYKTV